MSYEFFDKIYKSAKQRKFDDVQFEKPKLILKIIYTHSYILLIHASNYLLIIDLTMIFNFVMVIDE